MKTGLAQLAAQQRQVVRRDQLWAAGLTRDELRAFLAAGRWQSLGAVVIVMHNGPLDREQEVWAGVLTAGGAARLGGLTALEAAGLRKWPDARVHVMVPRATGVAHLIRVPVVIHETRRPELHPASPTGRPMRFPVERAAVDAASWSRDERSCCGLLAAVVQQRLTTAPRLREALIAAGPIRKRRVMYLAIEDIDGGAQALSEIDFGKLCRKYNLGTVRRQRVRLDAHGKRRYLDGEIISPSGKRVPFEVDGGLHMEALNFWGDLSRQNEFLILKSFPLRFSTYAMRYEEVVVADQIRRAGIA